MNDTGRETNITISSGTIVKTFAIVVLFVILFIIKDLVLVVLTSVVIAASIEPLTLWFDKYRIRRLPAVIATYLGIAFVLTGLFYFFVPMLIDDASSFLTAVPKYLDTVSLWNPLQSDFSVTKETVKSLSAGISEGNEVVRNFSSNITLTQFFEGLKGIFANVSEGTLRIVSTIFGGIFSFILIVVLSFYLAVQKDGIGNFLKVVTPLRYEGYIFDLWKRVEKKIGYWMQGQVFLGLLVGAIVYPVLVVFNVKNALFLAVLAALFEIIPLFGPVLAAIPAILIAYSEGGIGKAVLIAGAYTIVQQFENHIFYPLVVRKIIGVPPILVILALIIGFKLAGFLGLLLSVPIATMFMEYFDDLQKKKRGVPA